MDFDPRDRADDAREIEMPWVDVRDPDREIDDSRNPNEDFRDRDSHERDADPRDAFVEGLELPRGHEREIVLDGDRRYELNGDDSRTFATIGAFRVVANVISASHDTDRRIGVHLICAIYATKA
jgi:hypothetical protein